MRTVWVALALSLAATASLTACGGGGSDTTASQPQQQGSAETANGEAEVNAPDKAAAPKTLEGQLATTFPKPKVLPSDPPGAAAAIAAGRRTCKGKTPVEISEEFIVRAAPNLDEDQKKLVSELPSYEESPGPDFAAGQIAAGVYEATLPEETGNAGFRGCVYELATQFSKELSQENANNGGKQG